MSKEVKSLPDHYDCEILTGLTVDNVPQDASIGRVRQYRRGADVWQPEDRSDGIFFVKSGQVAIISSDRDGREVVFAVIKAGELFGELCFCAPKKHFYRENYARAIVKSEVLEIKLDDFMKYLQSDRDALQAFTFTLCCRLHDCHQRVEFLAYRGAEERIGRVLLHLAASRGIEDETKSGQTILPISHGDLAQIAAMSRPHVSVTMGKLRNRGLVSYDRNNPLKIDVEKLKNYLTGIDQSQN